MKKYFLKSFLISFVLLSIFGIFFYYFYFKTTENYKYKELIINEITEKKTEIKEEKIEPITLIFVGDIMLDRGIKHMVERYGEGDYRFPFLKIKDELNKGDLLFGNLESVISDKGTKIGSIYSFRADPKSIEGLTYAGFNLVSVANNHIFDYDREAMEDSFKKLNSNNIDYVGGGFNEKEAYSPLIKDIKGTKVAFLAYTNLGSLHWEAKEERSGIAWIDEKKIEEGIERAKEEADLVIVSFHYGDEYEPKSNSFQKYISRLSIDFGADLIIGHHPHVIQEIEEHNKKYIAYSLGNFIFDQGFSKETMEGLILKVIIENKEIKELIPVKFKMNEYFQPEIPKKENL